MRPLPVPPLAPSVRDVTASSLLAERRGCRTRDVVDLARTITVASRARDRSRDPTLDRARQECDASCKRRGRRAGAPGDDFDLSPRRFRPAPWSGPKVRRAAHRRARAVGPGSTRTVFRRSGGTWTRQSDPQFGVRRGRYIQAAPASRGAICARSTTRCWQGARCAGQWKSRETRCNPRLSIDNSIPSPTPGAGIHGVAPRCSCTATTATVRGGMR